MVILLIGRENGCEFCKPIRKRGIAKVKQAGNASGQITFDTRVKTFCCGNDSLPVKVSLSFAIQYPIVLEPAILNRKLRRDVT